MDDFTPDHTDHGADAGVDTAYDLEPSALSASFASALSGVLPGADPSGWTATPLDRGLLAVDVDGDLSPDAVVLDMTGDGQPDLAVTPAGDGRFEVTIVAFGTLTVTETMTAEQLEDWIPGIVEQLGQPVQPDAPQEPGDPFSVFTPREPAEPQEPVRQDVPDLPEHEKLPDAREAVDVNEDGVVETWIVQNGDRTTIQIDTDGDGVIDDVLLDDGNDGVADFELVKDGESVTITAYEDGEVVGQDVLTNEEFTSEYGELEGLFQQVDPEIHHASEFTPAEDDGATAITSEYAAQFWFEQSYNSSCLPSSVAGIISLYTGHQLTDLDFVELVDFEAISEGHGLPTTEAERLLEDAGIPAEIRTDVSVEELDQLLQDGYGVTIAIDSGEVWGQDTVDGDQESDHMVMVTEIDLEHGIVRLNDSGSPDGRSETMSLELFLDAWADSNNQAVICDVSLDEYWAEHGVPEAAEDIVVDDALGAAVRSPWALLPITVQQSDLS